MDQVVSLGGMLVHHILSYLIKNVPISSTLWISSSIHHISFERDYKGSSSGGVHRESARGSQLLKENLVMEQTKIKEQENQHHSEK